MKWMACFSLVVAGAVNGSTPLGRLTTSVWVYEAATRSSRAVGWIQRGSVVEIAAEDAGDEDWFAIRGGFVPRSAISDDLDGGVLVSESDLLWAKVVTPHALIRAAPDVGAPIVGRHPFGQIVAVLRDEPDAGWYRRPHGGYVAASGLRFERPDDFEGEHRPTGEVAFAFRATRMTFADGGTELAVPRFFRAPALEVSPKTVLTPSGALQRADVRVAFVTARHPLIPADARWVHVDLAEQTLTAYEGDQLVFSTLVSTGKTGKDTHTGLWRVGYKGLHDLMHAPDEYYVEEVPFILYFHGGEGLHGAFWHHAFGTPVSHGCVNLSLADARWIFEWAPPPLPLGWHTRLPGPGDSTLWVWVERRSGGLKTTAAGPSRFRQREAGSATGIIALEFQP